MAVGEALAKTKIKAKKKKFPIGAIVAIIIVVIIIIVVLCVVLFLLKRRKNKKASQAQNMGGEQPSSYPMANGGPVPDKFEPIGNNPQQYPQQSNYGNGPYQQQTNYGNGPPQQQGYA
jgi:flagellar basal body-associated protein FliL